MLQTLNPWFEQSNRMYYLLLMQQTLLRLILPVKQILSWDLCPQLSQFFMFQLCTLWQIHPFCCCFEMSKRNKIEILCFIRRECNLTNYPVKLLFYLWIGQKLLARRSQATIYKSCVFREKCFPSRVCVNIPNHTVIGCNGEQCARTVIHLQLYFWQR